MAGPYRFTTKARKLSRVGDVSWGGETDWASEMDRIDGVAVKNGQVSPVQGIGPTEGLIARYPFNEPGATDATGNHHGTINSATFLDDGGPQGTGAYQFDGDIDEIVVPDDSEFTVTAVTLSTWVKIDAKTNGGLISNYGGGSSNQHYGLRYGNNSGNYVPSFYYDDGDQHGFTILYGPDDIDDGNWHHVAGQWNGSAGTTGLYVDGVEVADSTGEYTGTVNPTGELKLGNDAAGSHAHLAGRLCDPRIYNRALSSEEIGEIHTATR